MDYFFLFLSVLCIAVQFSISRSYQLRYVRSFADTLFFSLISGISNVIFFTVLGLIFYGSLPGFSVFSILMALALAVISVAATFVGMMVMKYGDMSIYTMFMMLGGMILPYFFGIFFLDETLSTARIAGLALLICALPCSVIKKDGQERSHVSSAAFFALCGAIFLLNGMNSILTKSHSISGTAVLPIHFIVYVNLFQAILSGVSYGAVQHREKASLVPDRTVPPPASRRLPAVAMSASFAVVSGLGFMFNIIAAQTVPAVAMYPFITGGTIVFSAASAKIVFKEKNSRLALIGILLSLAGTLLFLF